MGELGWTLERYLNSTFYEFNEAAKGYWRRWERDIAWPAREIIFYNILGNPYIKNEDKPKNRSSVMKLSIDEKEMAVKVKRPSAEEIRKYQAAKFNLQ